MPNPYGTFTDDELRARLAARPDDPGAQREAVRRFLEGSGEVRRLEERIAQLEDEVSELESTLKELDA
ncbi:hypothetical protein CAL26_09860 [Bordetella genomosp. 9]|uniref:Uncharacterized protein n=1 Tax=Bordetella genomosp. 9 TaxID=1416803 RepID=A0A261RG07_9BORD|nr:hypothetical protein [Bordetella genomosp. 9]OZI23727.1 hypothetical protein CAL26_09860 [Bordetella genomosp. 9]